jgi:H+/Cl- antiporter ClcA
MRTRIFCGAFFLLMLNVAVGFAQTGPGGACGLADGDGTCPLDTWVLVLAAIGLVFGAVHLYHKGKHNPSEV